MPVVTGLGDVATYGAFGDASGDISFLNHYFGGASGTDVEAAMIETSRPGANPDLFWPDGFVAAQMIVQAVARAATPSTAWSIALEGWTFDSVKGEVTVRARDHALIQPMYQAKLVQDGGLGAKLVDTGRRREVAPPVAG